MESNTTPAQKNVNFGTWHPTIDETLFDKEKPSHKPVLTIRSTTLAYNDAGEVCAKKTLQNIKDELKKQNPHANLNDFNIEKSTQVKEILGKKQSRQLITFIAQHAAA